MHLAALEWSLSESIVIESPKDIQSARYWVGDFGPFAHQVQNLFTFCRRLPVSLIADDVGLGKTISAGLILSELMARNRVARALVICTRRMQCGQWQRELKDKFGLLAQAPLSGKELDKQLQRGAPVLITTYASIANRLHLIRPDMFQMLILDEAHTLRNLHGGTTARHSPRKLKSESSRAKRIRNALEKRLFRFVVMLTATPIQNRVWDLYSLIDCLSIAKSHQNPLGPPQQFEQRFLSPGKDGRQLHPASADSFRRILRQYIVRLRRGDTALPFPTREVQLSRVSLSPPEKDLYDLVKREVKSNPLNRLQAFSLALALMSSPQALAAQLQNMAERQPALRNGANRARALVDSCLVPAKLARLQVLCDELRAARPDWRVLVFTHRCETQSAIERALSQRGIAVGRIRGGAGRQNEIDIAKFAANPPQVHVLVSTDAGGEGINLQCANIVANYDLPWNPMVVEQRIGRVQRLKSDHKNVIVYNLVAADTVEELVVARLMEKLQSVAECMGDIESILESAPWDDRGFEENIRDLVIKSLEGQDVKAATQMHEESIKRASEEYQARRREIEDKLGRLDELHRSGPSAPKLTRAEPSLPIPEFVIQARRAEGAVVTERAPGLFEARVPGGRQEFLAFDPDRVNSVDAHTKASLYRQGSVAFDRLVTHWRERSSHSVRLLPPLTEADIVAFAKSWCATVPESTFLGVRLRHKERHFQGSLCIKVRATNGVDTYEKLVSDSFRPAQHEPVPPNASSERGVTETVRPGDWIPSLSSRVSAVVERDYDVVEFCRFYEARREEELRAASDDARLRHKVVEDFTPAVAAEVVGLKGVQYESVRLVVRFQVRGEGNYEASLDAVPATGQILDAPNWHHCGHTNLRVPACCLEHCSVLNRIVLKHLLANSEASNRRGLRDRLVKCQLTNQSAFDDEVGTSAVSATVALKRFFVTCETTGDLILLSEAGMSDFSGKRVRKDLLFQSERPPNRFGVAWELYECEVTKRRLLADEIDRCSLTGTLADTLLLERSALSGKLALREKMVKCEESETYFLPNETGECSVTKRKVDLRLLAVSAVSGSLALPSAMVSCACTMQLALPGELVECEESRQLFLPEKTGLCSVTRKRVDLRLMQPSKVSGRLALPSAMVYCEVSKEPALPGELQQCKVTGKRVLPTLLAICSVTGTRALKSEMVVCQQTRFWVLRSHSGKSDYSGKTVRRDLLHPSEKPPLRLGLVDEFGFCESSHKRLLLDELGTCSVSKERVDRTLLVPSARSGKLALPKFMSKCAKSEQLFLQSELATCVATGWDVDSRLLRELTGGRHIGQFALEEFIVRCAATGEAVLSDDLEMCQRTNMWVLPSELETCAATAIRSLRSELKRSDVSGEYVVPQRAVCSALTKRVGLPKEAVRCAWLEKPILRDEAAGCTLTGKKMAAEFLNNRKELIALRKLLDGTAREARPADDMIDRVRALDTAFFKGLAHLWVIKSPGGGKFAVCAELQRWFGLNIRYAGFFLLKGEPLQLTKRAVIGHRDSEGWHRDDEHEF